MYNGIIVNQEIKMYTRQQYMANEVTHQEYYGQFCSDSVIRLVTDRIGKDQILRSTNPHFNDIPLKQWDNLEPVIRMMVGSSIRKLNGQVSLSDCVCVAKAAARIIKENQNNA